MNKVMCLQDDILETYKIVETIFEYIADAETLCSKIKATINIDLLSTQQSVNNSIEYLENLNSSSKEIVIINDYNLFYGTIFAISYNFMLNNAFLFIIGDLYSNVISINNYYKVEYKWFNAENKKFVEDDKTINLLNMLI